MRMSERKQIMFTAAICLMVASLIYTPLARVHAGSAVQQTKTNRTVIRIGRPAATPSPAPTPTPKPTLQGNSNRRVIRIGGAARSGGNSNANTNTNTNSGDPAQRRDSTGPIIRREANSNRGVIRIGNTNSNAGAGANSNRPTVTNSNRNSGRDIGGIVRPGRTNSNSSASNTNSSSPDTGGPTLGGSRMAARVSLSPKVDAELKRMNRLTAAPRDTFAIPQRAQGMAQVALFNEKHAFGIFECDKAQGKDDLALEETADHIIVSFRCANSRNAMDRMATRGSNRLAVAFRKVEIKSTFTAQKSGATYGPTAAGMMRINSPARKLFGGRLPEGVSRDDVEMANCLSAFRRFRDDPAMRYFRVRFAARVYRCEVDMSRANYEMRNSGLFSGLVTRDDMPTVSAMSSYGSSNAARSTKTARSVGESVSRTSSIAAKIRVPSKGTAIERAR